MNSMDLYRVLFVIAVIAFVLITILLKAVKPLKNHYAYNITNDDLFKKNKDDFGFNYIYSTSGETRNFINKYVIRVNHSTKTLICNYTKYFKQISFHVVCMNKKRPIKVFKVNERNTSTKTSKIFLLPTKTKKVNVVICRVDGVSFNDKVVSPVPKSLCRFYTFFSGLKLLSFMFIVRQLIVEIMGNGYQAVFYDNVYNYITLILMGIIWLVYMISMRNGLRKRNWKNKVGGSLEYEFF